jgi:hypothetical protein
MDNLTSYEYKHDFTLVMQISSFISFRRTPAIQEIGIFKNRNRWSWNLFMSQI